MITKKTTHALKNKNKFSFHCNFCDYISCDRRNFNRHLKSKKHLIFKNEQISEKRAKNDTKTSKNDTKTSKKRHKNDTSNIMICDICEYSTNRKSNWERHIETKKHIQMINKADYKTHNSINNLHICVDCNKTYKYKSGLSRHKKICKETNTQPLNSIVSQQTNVTEHKDEITTEIVMNLLKTNKELQDIICNQNKEIVELAKQPKSQVINIENYLNIECKDAINMSDFINQIQITLDDLLYLGNNGFSKSVQQLMMTSLKQMEQTKRPIHCTNKRKKTLYIKDKDKWEKDNNNQKMKHVVQQFHKKELNDVLDVMDKNEEFFKQIDNIEKKNNIIIGITNCNKEETIKKITNHISQTMYLTK